MSRRVLPILGLGVFTVCGVAVTLRQPSTRRLGAWAFAKSVEAYHGNRVIFVHGYIDCALHESIHRRVERLRKTGFQGDVDIVVHSYGGALSPALGILHDLLQCPGTVRVWVPSTAFSGAAFLALCLRGTAQVALGDLAR